MEHSSHVFTWAPFPLHIDVGWEGHTHWNAMCRDIFVWLMGGLLWGSPRTVYFPCICPESLSPSAVLAPPMSCKAFTSKSPGLFCRCREDPDHLKWSTHAPPRPTQTFPSNLPGSSAVLSWPTPNVEVTSLPSTLLHWGQMPRKERKQGFPIWTHLIIGLENWLSCLG